MVDYQILSIMLTGIGMIIALTYYALQIRNQNKTRQAQLLMNLYEVYRSPEFRSRVNTVILQEWTNPEDFWERYGFETNLEAWTNWQSVATFFHGIGVLLKKGMIDISLVEELLVNIVFVSWYRMEPIVKEFRNTWSVSYMGSRRSERVELYSGFEFLYNELRKREKR